MGPVHTTRNGQRFRHYVTHPRTIREGDPAPYRLAADAIERICCELLASKAAAQVISIDGAAEAKKIADDLAIGEHRQRRALIIERVRKVTIGDAMLTMALNDGAVLEQAIERIRHGNEAKLVIGEPRRNDQAAADPQLIVLLKDAQRARALALPKPKLPLEQLAVKFGRSAERYKRLVRLSYLSPNIVGAIIAGEQPASVTNRFRQNLDGLPLSWASQDALLLR